MPIEKPYQPSDAEKSAAVQMLSQEQFTATLTRERIGGFSTPELLELLKRTQQELLEDKSRLEKRTFSGGVTEEDMQALISKREIWVASIEDELKKRK